MNVVTVHLVIHAQDQGISATQAATLLSVAAGICLFARIAIGGIADRIGCKPTLMICLAVSVIGFVLLLGARELWMLYTFAAIFGFSLWASGGLIPPITAELFGLKAHGNIYGAIYLSGAMGGAFGPVLVGYLYDVFGNYQLAFGICLFISICSLVFLILLDPIPKRSNRLD
jgi:MFS family permease